MLIPELEGDYNVEAALRESQRAWKAAVKYQPGGERDLGQLRLAPTGSITGRVGSTNPNVRDFSNTHVYIPGSSYNADARADGSYTLTNVPVGNFELRAFHVDLGDAAIPDKTFEGTVAVSSNQTTTAPALIMAINPPQLLKLTRARTQETTDNGAAGTVIDLHGKAFGFARGTRYQAQFSSGLPLTPDRLSDDLMRVVVPPDAGNGQIIQVSVTVGQLNSNPLPFRFMREMKLATSSLTLSKGATLDLDPYIQATDSKGVSIVAFPGEGDQARARPNVEITPRSEVVGVKDTILTVLAEGSVEVVVSAGDLPQQTLTVRVGADATPGSPPPGATPSPPRASGRMAADDSGDPAQHHDYLVTLNGATSTFVWIPKFVAYQLLDPVATEFRTKPAGAWVKSRPTKGQAGKDWVEEAFGGFYAAKFEAARADAVPGTPDFGGKDAAPGVSSTAQKVAQYCVPWTDVDWYQARNLATSYLPPYSHLMRDDEWAALAIWAAIHENPVYGNNAEIDDLQSYARPGDLENASITFLDDPSFKRTASGVDRALTGSGTSDQWKGDANLTTHTSTTGGVHDLNGNVREWTLNLTTGGEAGNYVIDGVDSGRRVLLEGQAGISALATAPELRRYGVPGEVAGPVAEFGRDHLIKARLDAGSMRGGS